MAECRHTYLSVYMDDRGDVQGHASPDPLAFIRDVPGDRGELLLRAVICGTIVEVDANNH